jgi:hypothetical protein
LGIGTQRLCEIWYFTTPKGSKLITTFKALVVSLETRVIGILRQKGFNNSRAFRARSLKE